MCRKGGKPFPDCLRFLAGAGIVIFGGFAFILVGVDDFFDQLVPDHVFFFEINGSDAVDFFQDIFGIDEAGLGAVNSAVHSYLIVSYAQTDGVSLDIGFYYMANAI